VSETLLLPEFYGTFWQRFDQKQRITIPNRWLPEDGRAVYFLAWPHEDGFISVYPKEFVQRMRPRSGVDKEAEQEFREARRHIFANAHHLVPDQQNRVTLDSKLLESFPLDSHIALVGNEVSFEIWNAKDRQSRMAEKPFLFDDALRTLTNFKDVY
jgi:DNA-binding transcriptional regulator/RsmH inhibitor MraZ